MRREDCVYRECHVNTAIKHSQEALDLARTSGHNDLMKCIIKSLGSAHFEKANELFIRPQELWELSPEFKKGLCEVQGHKCNIRLEQEKKCGSSRHLHLHSLTVEQGEVSHAVDQGLKGASKLNREWTKTMLMCRLIGSGTRAVDLYWLIDQFCLMLVEDLLVEVQQSADYLLKSLKSLDFDVPKDGHLIINETLWKRAENSKKRSTNLQFLFCIGFSVGHIRRAIGVQRALDAVPERYRKTLRPADYKRIVDELESQWRHEHYPKGLTFQKGLLWAERGRSRILINQFVRANRLHQDATEMNNLVNFNFTD